MKKLKFIIIYAFMILCSLAASAQDTKVVRYVEHVIYFRQGQADIDLNYMDNTRRLANLVKDIEIIRKDPETDLKNIKIVAGTSPEGVSTRNYNLSEHRARNMAKFITTNVGKAESYLQVEHIGIDWEGLAEMVKISNKVPMKDEMYEILTETPVWIRKKGIIVDGRRSQMERLGNEKPYWWMVSNMFPYVRRATIQIIYASENDFGQNIDELTAFNPSAYRLEQMGDLARSEEKTYVSAEAAYVDAGKPDKPHKSERVSGKPFVMALKTNLLSDVAAIPHLGVEFNLGKGFSLALDYRNAWWSRDYRDFYWRFQGADLSFRKYFGKKSRESALTGHHLGLYGQAFTFDFELGKKGYIADRLNYAAGLEYGYSIPVGKAFNFDFSIGAGFYRGEHETYVPMDDCYVWQETKRIVWVGPTKAEISLVWLIGNRSYYNKR